jgi:predicted homoserine dehydrogenase-like protein
MTNVYAYAKKDLKAGDELDGMGGYACYGLIENCAENEDKPGIPICLAENVTLKRDIAKDEKVYLADVDFDANEFAFDLYSKALDYSKKYKKSV